MIVSETQATPTTVLLTPTRASSLILDERSTNRDLLGAAFKNLCIAYSGAEVTDSVSKSLFCYLEIEGVGIGTEQGFCK